MNKDQSNVQAALTTAAAAAKQAGAVMASLRTRRGELVLTQNELERENAELFRQPLRREDLKALLLLSIDRWGEEFLAESWAPVVRDLAAPKAPRPQTLDAQIELWDNASARVRAARAEVKRVEDHLVEQNRQHAEAYAAAERGEPYKRPSIEVLQPDATDSPKKRLVDAERYLASLPRPGAVNLGRGTFERTSAPMMVQDAAAVLAGEHTSILASGDGEQIIDHYRNIFTGALLPGVPQDHRANQSLAVKRACFFLGDAIKAKVEKHFATILPTDTDAEKDLLSLDVCRASIAANEERVRSLQEEIAGIDAQLAELQSALRH